MMDISKTSPTLSYHVVIDALDAAFKTPTTENKNSQDVWEFFKKAADFNFYKPQTRPDVHVEESNASGAPHFILKEPKRGLYIQIAPEDHYVYGLMDGSRTVVDLVVAYCMRYKAIAQTRVVNFVQSLRGWGLLVEEFYDVYDTIKIKLERRKVKYWTDQLLRTFITRRQIAIGGIDRAVGTLYKRGGWIFYTRPILLLMLLIVIVGGIASGILAFSSQYSILGNQESVASGLLTLAILEIFSVVLHECGHALTLKHFKREVRRAGLLFYMGMIGAFVDTTDIWHEGKSKRLAVTAAGPFVNLFLGGAAALLIVVQPTSLLNGLLYRFMLTQYFMVGFNASPFLKLDGYYLLADLLGIANLRERAFEFLQHKLPKTFLEAWSEGRWLPALTREEKFMGLYGIVAALWTANLFLLGVLLAPVQFINIVKRLFSGASLGQLLLPLAFVLSLLFGFLPLVFTMAQRGVKRLMQLAQSQPAQQVCLLLIGLSVATTLLPLYVASESELIAALYARILTTSATVVATVLAFDQIRLYRGSQWRPVFIGIGLLIMLVAAANLIQLLFPNNGFVTLQLIDQWYLIALSLGVIGIALRWRLFMRSFLAELRWVWVLIVLGTACIVLTGLTPPPTVAPHIGAQLGQYLWCAGLFLHWHLTRRGLPQHSLTQIPPEILQGDAQTQAGFAIKWIGEHVVQDAFAAIGTQSLLTLAREFNRANAATMRRVWLTKEGELGMNPKSEWSEVEANWRFVLDDLLDRVASIVGEQLTQSALYEAFAEMPRPVQPAGLLLLKGSNWRAGLDALANPDGDRIYLHQALLNLSEQVMQTCWRTYGWLLTEHVIANFNRKAVLHHWGIWLRSPGKFDNRPGFNVNNDLLSEQWLYREALHGLMDSLSTMMGREAVQQALLRARDNLPWTQREIADNLLLNSRVETDIDRLTLLRTAVPAADHTALLRRTYTLQFRAGKVIARQGRVPNQVIIIVRGQAQALQQSALGEHSIEATLTTGAAFGYESVITQTPLPTSLCAATNVEVLIVDRSALIQSLKNDVTSGQIHDWMMLRSLPMFRDLALGIFEAVVAAFEHRSMEQGQLLIEQGKPVGALFVIQSGQLEVSIEAEGSPQILARLGPGEICGEQSLLTGNNASATVRAIRATVVLQLNAQRFRMLLQENQTVLQQIEQVGSRRRLTIREPFVLRN